MSQPPADPSSPPPPTPSARADEPAPTKKRSLNPLDVIERLGNMLPEPPILFAALAAIVVVVSTLGATLGWQVQPVRLQVVTTPLLDAVGQPVLDEAGKPRLTAALNDKGRPQTELKEYGEPIKPRSLMTIEGVYWMFSSMLRNFAGLPALPLVFVGMIGIGLAEKLGLFSALMRVVALNSPRWLLTPVIVFVGANSSVASDAGYIILPPLAAALYAAIGRSPIAGMAAAFCGVAGGFGGGLFPTAGDGFLAGVATQAAHIIDPKYPDVVATHNLFFKGASAFIVMFVGWFVTDKIVEPRLNRQVGKQEADTSAIQKMSLTPLEKKGLLAALATNGAILAAFFAMVLIPGMPLHGQGTPTLANGRVVAAEQVQIVDKAAYEAAPSDRRLFAQEPELDKETKQVVKEGYYVISGNAAPSMSERPGDRWAQVIVPLILLSFLIPGMVYGLITGTMRSQKDFIEGIYHGIRALVPVLVIMFFLGQFVNYFQYTGLDRMLAYAGGSLLVTADLPVPLLVALFVLLVVFGDFAMSGMLSKFAVMAPIFIPMFMMVGISPELTTAAYRIGDSVVNIVTPLNSYLLIILAVYQKYKKEAGLGHLMSLMIPYSVLLFISWTGFLLIWYFAGFDLGPSAPLNYTPKF
ncbi:MAG: AbgT family transporter [Planctomycetota bacterium]|nr:AbgT family transporter [Planctomycetota bacterium]